MSTVTTRLGLVKPAGTEQVDVAILNANSDQIDYTSGVILVNAGVVPPNSSLYDGAIVTEKTTGVVWVAVKNGGGGFDKIYMSVPANNYDAGTVSGSVAAVGAEAGFTPLLTIPVKPYSRNFVFNWMVNIATAAGVGDTINSNLRINGTAVKFIRGATIATSGALSLGGTWSMQLAANTALTCQGTVTKALGSAGAVTWSNLAGFNWLTVIETPTYP